MAKAQPAAVLVATTESVESPAIRKLLRNALPTGRRRNASPNALSDGAPGSHTGGSFTISDGCLSALVTSQKSGKAANAAASTMAAVLGRRRAVRDTTLGITARPRHGRRAGPFRRPPS